MPKGGCRAGALAALILILTACGSDQAEPRTAEEFVQRAKERLSADPEGALQDLDQAEKLGADVDAMRRAVRREISIRDLVISVKKEIQAGREAMALSILEPWLKKEPVDPRLKALARSARGIASVSVETADREYRVVFTPLDAETLKPSDQDIPAGDTPLEGFDLELGTYLMTLTPERGDPVTLEVLLKRDKEGLPESNAIVFRNFPPQGFILIPGGEFPFGGGTSTKENPRQNPRRTIHLDDYWIARDEVTNRQYADFLKSVQDYDLWRSLTPITWDEGAPPFGFDEVPVSGVDLFQAMVYAARLGARLPTEPEWEKAGRGITGRTYPWGNDPSDIEGLPGHLEEVHRKTVDVSPYRVRGLVSRVAEWTHTPSRDHYYDPAYDGRLRGGSYAERGLNPSPDVRRMLRLDFVAETMPDYRGFRLVRSIGKEDPWKPFKSTRAERFIRVAMIEILSGRFDAKEELVKALGSDHALMAAIQLVRLGDPRGVPYLATHPDSPGAERELRRFLRIHGSDAAARVLLDSKDEVAVRAGIEAARSTKDLEVIRLLFRCAGRGVDRAEEIGTAAISKIPLRGTPLGTLEEIKKQLPEAGSPVVRSQLMVRSAAIHLLKGDQKRFDSDLASCAEAYPRALWLAAYRKIMAREAPDDLLEKALKEAPKGPDRVMAYLLRSIVRLRAVRPQEAYEDMLRAKDAGADTADMVYLDALKGMIELAQGRMRRAERYLQKAVEKPPTKRIPLLDNLPELSRRGIWEAWKKAR
jgi:formylglycine-generating enzyme required for sulfatase activity/Flp pilus assembly protein TadD